MLKVSYKADHMARSIMRNESYPATTIPTPTDPDGLPIYYIAEIEGFSYTVCADCANNEVDPDLVVIDYAINLCRDENTQCDLCEAFIPWIYENIDTRE